MLSELFAWYTGVISRIVTCDCRIFLYVLCVHNLRPWLHEYNRPVYKNANANIHRNKKHEFIYLSFFTATFFYLYAQNMPVLLICFCIQRSKATGILYRILQNIQCASPH